VNETTVATIVELPRPTSAFSPATKPVAAPAIEPVQLSFTAPIFAVNEKVTQDVVLNDNSNRSYAPMSKPQVVDNH